MKRFSQLLCLILVFAMLLCTTAFAAETIEPRASIFFAESSVYFWHVSGSQYQIWFDVTAVSGMTELGVSKIVVEQSSDLEDWTPVKTYEKENYSQMTTTTGTGHYANYVTYYPTDGFAYRAIVTLYAKNSNGTGKMNEVTETLDLR